MANIRDQLPAAIQGVMQDGLLERAFHDALRPELLFPLAGSAFPVQGRVGDRIIQTRQGLLTPQTTPLGGSDPTPEKWSMEQWEITLDDYGHTIDTDLLAGSMSIESEFFRDSLAIAQNAGQSLNRIAREKLYEAYAGGNTWVTAATGPAVTVTVEDASGFSEVLVDGVVTPVSAANPLPITIEESGTPQAVNVEGVAGNVLTLDTSVTVIIGDRVIADAAPFSVFAGTGNTVAYDLAGSDTVTLADFRAAVVRLRRQNVPTVVNGLYVAHIDSETENQLWDDTTFQNVLNTNIDARQFTDLTIGAAAGILFVRNEEVPTLTGAVGVTVRRPIVLGGRALMNAPYAGYQAALTSTPQDGTIQFIDVGVGLPVAWIVNAPQDRMNRYLASAWGWVGDFGVPSDSVTGDAALFKRAVVVQHA